MTLQGAIDSALPTLRAEAFGRMKSRCKVRRKTGATAQNEATGVEAPVWAIVHADEAMRYVAASTRPVKIAGIEFQEATGRGDFRHDLVNLADDDYIEILAGEWAGTVLRVLEAVKGDQRTARRVPVVEASRPQEW